MSERPEFASLAMVLDYLVEQSVRGQASRQATPATEFLSATTRAADLAGLLRQFSAMFSDAEVKAAVDRLAAAGKITLVPNLAEAGGAGWIGVLPGPVGHGEHAPEPARMPMGDMRERREW